VEYNLYSDKTLTQHYGEKVGTEAQNKQNVLKIENGIVYMNRRRKYISTG